MMGLAGVAWAALQLALLLALPLALWHLVLRPRAVARSFARQGIRGPRYTFLAGSMPEAKRLVAAGRIGVPPLDAGCHDIIPLVLPQFHRWVAEYGKTFLFWIGPIPAILSLDLELIKQVLADRTGLFPKDFMIPVLKILFGNGVILINGDDWKRHRKVVLPAFNHDKLKSMTVVTSQVTDRMIQRWRNQIQQSGGGHQTAEIDMNLAFCDLTEEIIGRVAFGTSQNHPEAREVVIAMREMQKLGTASTMDPPILWYLPTRRNMRVRHLDKLLKTKIMSIMQARVAARDGKYGYGDDLVGLLLEAWSPEQKGKGETLTTQEVIDEWKTFFAAGQETTATLLVWAMFLLSVHPQWQDKVREEVLQECGGDGEVFNVEVLGKLKLLHMVLLETLRLYPPIEYIQRRAATDVVLKDISVPRGTVISIPIGMLHRDTDVWGPDADEFNPMRFQNGISRAAKDPKALLAFSLGPRACTGQSFGIMEAQVVMAMILSKFSFSLSPKYVHKPKYLLSLAPRSGMPLILRNIDT
ncbi:hypothetical protein PR202_gn00119 [Eleusine coracana subsp. coracana]|uniref:Cytochrome P450 709B2 n=1 Tax=Eleusine coracana subsp. coracana TaxID=191504 RepID=A0AAV5G3Y2_ELECO|nr:hypothetical protein PR202_gb20014 [Eleusine coracana subsp. coracana]GJN40816.1 hypothetical protein PR202_gn00119 [Eleusine coracana subsp. coracana]